MTEVITYKCNKCKDTGVIKYKEIEDVMFSWQPWLEKNCECNQVNLKTIVKEWEWKAKLYE